MKGLSTKLTTGECVQRIEFSFQLFLKKKGLTLISTAYLLLLMVEQTVKNGFVLVVSFVLFCIRIGSFGYLLEHTDKFVYRFFWQSLDNGG